MNKFFNLFAPKTKTQVNNIEPIHTNTMAQNDVIDLAPPMELFIDNEPPQAEKATRKPIEKTVERPSEKPSKSKISAFLSRNFLEMGINDGFEYSNYETLEIAKKKIKAEFQLILDEILDEKRNKLLEMQLFLINVTNISTTVEQRLEKTINALLESSELLEKQKMLAAENEGWVMNAVHAYQQGFVQGLNTYLEGEELLNAIKNI